MANKEVFIIGMIAGLIIGAASGITLVVSTYDRAIYQCEQSLPKNVHCIITAIVEKPDE